jgi:hypothetical protein
MVAALGPQAVCGDSHKAARRLLEPMGSNFDFISRWDHDGVSGRGFAEVDPNGLHFYDRLLSAIGLRDAAGANSRAGADRPCKTSIICRKTRFSAVRAHQTMPTAANGRLQMHSR